MRTAFVALNLLVATASAGVFAYTFFARAHLTGLAEEYVVTRTVRHVTPTVEPVEAALKHPLALLAPATVREAVQAEVDSFRRDPNKYVRDLVVRGAAIEVPKHPFAEQVLKWKQSVQSYFDRTLASLIRDVRIFAGTNVVAALLAAWFASRARGQWRWHLLGVSALLLAALALQAYLFIDGLTFFRIITNARMGWSYPLLVAITFGYLYWRIGRFVPVLPTAPNPSSPPNPVAVR